MQGAPHGDWSGAAIAQQLAPAEGLELTFDNVAGVAQLAEQLFCNQVVCR
jgi:hypothetical protein